MQKVKRFLSIGLIFPLILTACSKKNGVKGENGDKKINISDYVDDFEMPHLESNTDETFEGEKLAIDLTKMSSTMVYAEVFNMLLMPEEYNGKLIKVRGTFSQFVPNGKTQSVTTVVVSDALGCCQQGLEFSFADVSPLKNQSLPELNQEIEIIGRFILTQTEEGLDFFYLDCKSLKVL